MAYSPAIAKLKAKIATLKNLILIGCKKYIIRLIELEQQLEDAIAQLLKPQVLQLNEFSAVVRGSQGSEYKINLSPGLLAGERCNCKDCFYRRRKCKHQLAVEEALWCSIEEYAENKLDSLDLSSLGLFPEW